MGGVENDVKTTVTRFGEPEHISLGIKRVLLELREGSGSVLANETGDNGTCRLDEIPDDVA